jgi:predicted RNase H-like HicB family nuclease
VPVTLTIDIERETDGRWLAEVPELPGVLAYGSTEAAAVVTAEAIALRVLADRLERSGDDTLVSLTFNRATS